jgi:hypothetical protein
MGCDYWKFGNLITLNTRDGFITEPSSIHQHKEHNMALRPAPYDPAKNPYPKMVYPGGKPVAGKGRLVKNKEEEDAYVGSLKEADTAKSESKSSEAKSEGGDDALKAVLLAEAEALGVKTDKRWGIEKLQDAVSAARKPASSETA